MAFNLLGRWRSALAGSSHLQLVRLMPAASPWLTALAAATLLVGAALPSAFAVASGQVIAAFVGHLSLVTPLVLLGGVFVLQQAIGPVRAAAADGLGRRFKTSVGLRVMAATLAPATIAHLEDPDVLDHVDAARTPGWVDPRIAATALVNQLGMWLQGVVAVLLLAQFNEWLAAVVLAAYVYRHWVLKRTEHQLFTIRWGRAQRLRRADYLRNLAMTPAAAKELRIFGLGDWLVGRFEQTWLAAMAELWATRPNLNRYIAVASAPAVASLALSIGLLGHAALAGGISLAQFMVYSQALALVTRTIGAYSDDDSRVALGAAGLQPLERLEQKIAGETKLHLAGRRDADGLPRREVRFEGVGFAYGGGSARAVFERLDLTIPAGQSLAIVGANGAGKTTLIKLLARLYDPSAGRITVDDIDLRDLDPRLWQRRLAVLFQEFTHYAFSAADNIGLGAVEYLGSAERIQAAATQAGAAGIIEGLPFGWQTTLSRQFTGGTELSGGEW
jgi:ATP-binding cassette, subfamily B, bacterial